MHRPRYTPVAPVNAQCEYNIPLEDDENGDNGGAPFGPAPPGRHVPNQAPPSLPPRNQGKGKNPDPPVRPLQVRLLLSHHLMTFMSPRHLPSNLPLGMILIPHMDFSIQILLALISMIRGQPFTRMNMIHLLHHGLGIITQGMEGSRLGIGIIP